MTELNENESSGVATREFMLVMLSCVLPPFLLFTLLGDQGRGRAAVICTGVMMIAVRACWSLRKHMWFWITAGTLFALHMFFVLFIPWTDKSYPGFALLPVGLLDYGIMYGCIKLVEKVMNSRISRRSA